MSYTKKLNFFLLLFPILIFSLSYAVLVSTAPERAREQLLFFGIGYVLFVAVTFIDYNFYKFFWKHIYALTLFTLVLTLFFGETRLGATRWLNLGFISLQTSEVAKIGLVFMLAGFISEHQDVFKNIKIFLRLVLLLIPLFALVLIQPDLGSTIVLFTVAAGILFYAGLSKFYILGGLALFGVFSTPTLSEGGSGGRVELTVYIYSTRTDIRCQEVVIHNYLSTSGVAQRLPYF